MRKLLRILSLVLLVMTAAQTFDANASETLFEYPQAPNDTTMKLEERCNYLTQHWWDKMNFSAPIPESKDSLLVEAMTTYIEVMKNANFNVGLASIRDLMFKAQTNQPNFMKIAAVAQLLLYYNNASVKDDVYETFAKAVVDASWVKADVKTQFKHQLQCIANSKLNEKIADFTLTTMSGGKVKLTDVTGAECYLLFFCPEDMNGSIARTRLSTDVTIGNLVKEGKVKVVCVTNDKTSAAWQKDSKEMATEWTVGHSDDVFKNYDIRITPSFMVLDKDYKVVSKNLTIDQIKNMF
jgi:peroxiredoxin